MRVKTILLTVLTFAVLPTASFSQTYIKNNVSSSANTGGNTATPATGSGQAGQNIETGESSASIKVKTVIDGEEIANIEKVIKTTGDAVVVEADQEIEIAENENEEEPTKEPDKSNFSLVVTFFQKVRLFFTGLFR